MNETLRYLFGIPLPGFHWSDNMFLAISAVLFFVGIALVLFKHATRDRLRKHLLARWYTFALTIGILGLVWAWLRSELVQVLSVRFGIVCVMIAAVVWAVYLLKYTLTDYRKQREQVKYEEQKRKYM
jgi:hypothetical protein